MEQGTRQPIGKVVGTERQPNTAFQFFFWANPEAEVGIGSFVTVKSPEVELWATVVEAYGYTDLQTPMFDFLGHDSMPDNDPPTLRPEIRLFKATVLRREPEEPVQPAPIATVFLAGADDVQKALRIDRIPEERRIPIGLYQSGPTLTPISVDADFLLGPEAGHLNVTGTSGLAAKTSFIEFMISSIFAKHRKSVAVLCFNVKGPDLLFLDHEPAPPKDAAEAELLEQDCRWFDELGIDRKPFKNVQYFAPYRDDGFSPATLRTHSDLQDNCHPLCWGLRDVMRYTEVVLNKDDIDVKADAFLQFITQRVVEADEFSFSDTEANAAGVKQTWKVRTFGDLNDWFEAALQVTEATNASRWRSHAVETMRKVHNRMQNLTTRFAGLLTDGVDTNDLPFGAFQDRTVYVVDIAGLKSEAQDLVFARTIAELRESMEKRTLGVETLIVMVDELNQYAPSFGKESYVARTLRDICARGRYLGLVLFGAQQFRSQVDRQIVGNCATAAWGQIEMEEMAQAGYGVFDPAVKEKLGALSPGEMLIKHPHFQQPVFIKFPRPCVMRGRDGIIHYPAKKEIELVDAVWQRLRKLDSSLTRNEVADVVANGPKKAGGETDRQAVMDAMNATVREKPTAALSYFKRLLPQPVETRPIARPGVTPAEYPNLVEDPDDPFA